jgi:hypothetical protein
MVNHLLSNGYAAPKASPSQLAKVAMRLHKWRILVVLGARRRPFGHPRYFADLRRFLGAAVNAELLDPAA